MGEVPVLSLRPATGSDCIALARFVNAGYRGESSRAGWTTEADLLGGQRVDADGLRELVGTQGRVVLLHEPAGEIVACVALEKRADDCHLGMLTVRPTLQATGLGRSVLAAAELYAREKFGATRMSMWVIAQRAELIAWYERRGYRRTGRFEPFPYGDERFGLPRRPDLRFEVLEKRLTGTPSDPPATPPPPCSPGTR
ncbi:MAG: GNAT family N-acetyltransferase [Gammaproteobacteria bacterium]|nr:GNAT family N-acetyltransferase [Gammaproteobacteria bacterium]